MSGSCGLRVLGQPKGHKLSIRQSSEDPSRIKELISMKYILRCAVTLINKDGG